MTESKMRGLRRVLLLTDGEAAATIAEQTLALGRSWLGCEPLLVQIALPQAAMTADADALEMLAAACDRLADGAWVAELAAAGWGVAKSDEIEAWLLIDAGSRPAAARVPGAAAASDLPLARVAALSELAWQRLRVYVTVRAFLLAEPTTQAAAAVCAEQLAATGVEQLGLLGPVDAARLRWTPDHWQAAAARSLATLLWSDAELAPDRSQAYRPAPEADHASVTQVAAPAAQVAMAPATAATEAQVVWGIGAAAWPTPQAALMQWLSVYGAHATTARLLAAPAGPTPVVADPDDERPPWELPALTIAPERHRLSVDAAAPPEPPGLVWGQRRPGWEALAALPAALRTAADARASQAHDAQYEPRGAWLAGQVDAWQAALQQLRSERLTPGWPELLRFQGDLDTLITRLRAASALIEDWLEAAGARFRAAEDAVARAETDLASLCQSFPPANRRGLWIMLAQPWRWPALAWAYLGLLPQFGQKYLDACYHRGAARWAEANLHALRQAYLAMAQIVQDLQQEVAALTAQLAALEAELARRLAAAACPPPWDAARLASLARRMLGDAGPGLAWILVEPASDGEAAQDATVVDASALARLSAWVGARLAPLARWTAADWLTAGLEPEALLPWFDDFARQATPLWPAAAQAEAEVWLLCPAAPAADGEADTGAAARLEAALQAWVQQQGMGMPQAHCGRSHADVLLLLRGAQVPLADGLSGGARYEQGAF